MRISKVLREVALEFEIRRRALTGERSEVADQVGLIVVSGVMSQRSPALKLVLLPCAKDSLESENPEQFDRGKPNLTFEPTLELSFADSQIAEQQTHR